MEESGEEFSQFTSELARLASKIKGALYWKDKKFLTHYKRLPCVPRNGTGAELHP